MNLEIKHIQSLLRDIADHQAKGLSVYFIGIGGIGMSALARYFNSRGVQVSGYDKTETELTRQLVNEGMRIHYTDDFEAVDKSASFVVYTPAVPKQHAGLQYYLNNNFPVLKRSEILGLITDSSYNICVAGTHGKTTTSTMVAHLLKDTGFGCNAFLGGIASNYNTNFWSSEKNVCVVEADEFDRSFLKLSPDIAVITAADPDHLDIYGNAETFREAFEQFSLRVKPGGCLLVRHGLGLHAGSNTNTLTYSVEDQDADYHILSYQILNGSFHFDLMADGNQLTGFELRMGGLHNLENAVAAIAVSLRIGIEVEKIRLALRSFSGVKRRFEYIWQNEKMMLIDDYAHHPKELTALIEGARRMFEGKKITLVFQPHLYSRTRDFADGFARALSLADVIYILPIYPARELPIEGIDSQWIASKMHSESVSCLSKDALLDKIRHQVQSNDIEVLITAGAGDIDTLVIPIKNIFENN